MPLIKGTPEKLNLHVSFIFLSISLAKIVSQIAKESPCEKLTINENQSLKLTIMIKNVDFL